MANNGGDSVYVLYKVVNSDTETSNSSFNCFPLPPGGGRPTLASIKQHCSALYNMNHLGPEGYHWRVCVEDNAPPGDQITGSSISWWDIQDENASLPVKEATQHQLGKFFAPAKKDHSDDVTKAAKGAFKSLGKAVSQAVGGDDHEGVRVKVVAFKLLDIVKMHDDFEKRNRGRATGSILQQPIANNRPPARQTQAPVAARPPQRGSAPAQHQHQRPPQQPTRQPVPQQEPSLMDFGSATTTTTTSNGGRSQTLHHTTSMPTPPSNESRAEKLKREYALKNQNAKRVWDPIDERWIEADQNSSNMKNVSNKASKKKEVGISLDPSSAVGKSANVQEAVNNRVNDMRKSQAEALHEVRAREEKKKKEDAEEDEVRKRLEPKIKTWSEEHGKKKQLRALLASLQTILWPGSNWKPVTIGDLLDDKKVKLAFHKASRVVHPDKTHHLNAEQRFLAKRIFDALSQAKTEFDDGKQ